MRNRQIDMKRLHGHVWRTETAVLLAFLLVVNTCSSQVANVEAINAGGGWGNNASGVQVFASVGQPIQSSGSGQAGPKNFVGIVPIFWTASPSANVCEWKLYTYVSEQRHFGPSSK